jgi:hypothetical protein
VRDWRFTISDTEIHVFAKPGFDPFCKNWQLGFDPINAGLSV